MDHSRLLLRTALDGVHALRRDPAGINLLKQTGQFRDYMQDFVDLKERPFIAWDGEGYTDNDLDHHYMLLQNSVGDNIHAPRLTSVECLELLLKGAGENPGAIHIIYGGGYDATHWFRDIPLEMTAQLRDNNTITWTVPKSPGVTPNQFTINYLPHKWTQIRGYDYYSHRFVQIKIYDVMTYFQSKFTKALESRGIHVYDAVTKGKAARSDFSYLDLEEIRLYCQLELEGLVQLANTLRKETQDAGVYVTQWHGPATISKALLKRHGVRDHMQTPEAHIEQAAQLAYFGGHFEQYKAGHYDGNVFLYDINSAYPHALRTLPSLAGGRWEWSDTFTGEMGVWRCHYSDMDGDHVRPHPAPWRGKGGVVGFPTTNTETWLWTPEATIPGITITGGWTFTPSTITKPFDYIPELYNLRRQWKDEGRGGEKALKLGLNSMYGCLAQRIGGNPDKNGGRPAWHQLEWAGMITSTTRRMLWDAIAQDPTSVIAVETDSIMTTRPLTLDVGDDLGQWGLTEYDWVTYVQNGIYFTSNGVGKSKSKTRGIDAKELDHNEVLTYLAGDRETPMLVSSRNFIGLGNPRTYLYGKWQDSTKDVRVAGQKRVHVPQSCTACQTGQSMATHLHDLIAAPHYGATPSIAHPLPWLTTDPLTDDVTYAGDVIEDYETERHL